MGSSTPPKINKNDINVIMSIITQITQNNLQQCTQQVQFSQTINLICNVDPTVAIAFATSEPCLACANALKTNANIDCNPQCKACVQSNFNQSATFVLSQSCNTSSAQAATIKNSIDAQIDQQIENTQSVLSQVLASIFGSGQQANNINKTTIATFLKNMITQNNVQELLNLIDTNQQITIVGTGGSVQSGVTQSFLFYSTSTLIATNAQEAGVTNAVALTASQGIVNKSGSDSSLIYIILAVVLVLILAAIGFGIYKKVSGQAPPAAPAPPLRTLAPSRGIARGVAVPNAGPNGVRPTNTTSNVTTTAAPALTVAPAPAAVKATSSSSSSKPAATTSASGSAGNGTASTS